MPKFEVDLKTFPKQPIWMRQIESNKGSAKVHVAAKFTIIILIICLIIIIAFS